MNLGIVLLMVAVSAPKDSAAEHARYMALHGQWRDIHLTARQERSSANALLVFDPREEAVWLEKDGRTDASDVRVLPPGLDWSAYLITPQGAVQIPFPVRLSRPRFDANDDDTEEIWIVGSAKDRQWQFSISASPSGHAFHVGSGSPISSINFTMPRLEAAPRQDLSRESVLVSESTLARKWTDTLRNKWFSVNVLRPANSP